MNEPREPVSRAARYRFGVFELDAATLELRKEGRTLRVRPQSLKLLALLLAHPGDVVSREAIQQALWGRDTFVDFEQGVNHAIRELRAVMGDSAESPRFIRTFARRGYGFIAPVEPLAAEEIRSVPVSVSVSVSVSESPPAVPAAAPPAPRRRLAVAAGLGAFALAAAMLVALTPWSREAPAEVPTTIAVVPFTSPDSDPALGAGLASAIVARLGAQHRAFVRSAPSPLALSGNRGSLDSSTLVLSGEAIRRADDINVTARLERAASGELIWTQRFQLRATELHSLENVIAEHVVSALDLRIAAAEQDRLRRRYTENVAAYQDYLRGRALLVRYTPDATLGAIEAFESAIERDPAYTLARAGLAMACADMCLRFARPPDVDRWGQRAEAEARAALDLDANLAEAHLARAAVARKREFDWNQVVVSSRRALALNPNLDQAHFFIAAAYAHLGYMEEAGIAVESGRKLHGGDALEPIRQQGIIELWSGHFAPARVHLEEASRLSDQAIADTYLALAYYYSGSVEQSRTLLETLSASSSASSAARAGAALASVVAKANPAAARTHLERVTARGYRDHHVAYSFGTAYAQLGDAAEAIRWLKTAADIGFPCVTLFERDPLLDPLREDPGFAELLSYVRGRRDAALQ